MLRRNGNIPDERKEEPRAMAMAVTVHDVVHKMATSVPRKELGDFLRLARKYKKLISQKP